MFDRLTISDHELSAGALGEALFYYGRTNVVVGGGNLPALLREFGFENLIRCLDMGVLSLTFERKRYSVLSNANVIRYHGFGVYELARDNDGRKIRGMADDIELALTRSLGNTEEVRRQAKALADRTKQRGEKSNIRDEVIRDVVNQEYFSTSVRQILSVLTPSYKLPDNFHVSGTNTPQGLIVSTNIDFREVNRIYHLDVDPKNSTIDDAYLLSHVLDARKEITFASELTSDLWLSPAIGAVLRNKVNMCAARLDRSCEEISLFQKVEFEGNSIRESIDGRQRSVTELVGLLEGEEFQKFQAWLRSQPPEASLLREYHQAVFGRHTSFNGTTSKLIQIFVFTGIGMAIDAAVGTAGLATVATAALGGGASVATGVGQEFILGKLLEGWQPNQFIDRYAKKFISS